MFVAHDNASADNLRQKNYFIASSSLIYTNERQNEQTILMCAMTFYFYDNFFYCPRSLALNLLWIISSAEICEWQFSNYQQKKCSSLHNKSIVSKWKHKIDDHWASCMFAKVQAIAAFIFIACHSATELKCWTIYVKCDDNETSEIVECAELTALNDLPSGEDQINFNTNDLIRRNNRWMSFMWDSAPTHKTPETHEISPLAFYFHITSSPIHSKWYLQPTNRLLSIPSLSISSVCIYFQLYFIMNEREFETKATKQWTCLQNYLHYYEWKKTKKPVKI